MESETVLTGRYIHYSGAECIVSSVDVEKVYGKWVAADACFAIPLQNFLEPYRFGTFVIARFTNLFRMRESQSEFLRLQLWRATAILDAIQSKRLTDEPAADALESICRMLDGLEPLPVLRVDGAVIDIVTEPLYDLATRTWIGTCPCVLAEQVNPECPFHGRKGHYSEGPIDEAVRMILESGMTDSGGQRDWVGVMERLMAMARDGGAVATS